MADIINKLPAGNVENLLLYKKFEEFVYYFEPIVEKFPHYENCALKADIKQCLHRVLELIIVTNRSSRKLEGWYKLDTEFEILMFYQLELMLIQMVFILLYEKLKTIKYRIFSVLLFGVLLFLVKKNGQKLVHLK